MIVLSLSDGVQAKSKAFTVTGALVMSLSHAYSLLTNAVYLTVKNQFYTVFQ